MPTARPSISARIGAVFDISTAPETQSTPEMPTATPTSAVSMVIPAATTEAKVIISTASATMTPSPSVEPMDGVCLTAPPPSSMRSPSTRLAAARSAIASWVLSGISLICPPNWTCANPT